MGSLSSLTNTSHLNRKHITPGSLDSTDCPTLPSISGHVTEPTKSVIDVATTTFSSDGVPQHMRQCDEVEPNNNVSDHALTVSSTPSPHNIQFPVSSERAGSPK